MPFTIKLARSDEDFAAVESLIRQYVDWLGLHLSFQSYQAEIENLAHKYTPPAGAMFLAQTDDGKHVGCCGFAPLSVHDACEAKRLFVSPEARHQGIAKSLMMTVIERAERAGYKEMFLDALPKLVGAVSLYEALGFQRVKPYYDNPVPSAMFFCKQLDPMRR